MEDFQCEAFIVLIKASAFHNTIVCQILLNKEVNINLTIHIFMVLKLYKMIDQINYSHHRSPR